jgi:hypothetical protein
MASTLALVALGLGGGFLIYQVTKPRSPGGGGALQDILGSIPPPQPIKQGGGVINVPPSDDFRQSLVAAGGSVKVNTDGSYRYVIPSKVSPSLQTYQGSYATGTPVTNPGGTAEVSGTGAGKYVIPR